jgi:DNA-binding HxlR family transcriptional regulator
VARNAEQGVGRKPQARTPAGRAKGERRLGPLVPEFDSVIHERVRLGIVSALAVNESMNFTDLKRLLKTTDGNLSVHARKLEDAGYLACSKFFEGRMPRTEYRLTGSGRQAFERYLRDMESMIRAARER